ncbi:MULTISPECIES: phosphoglycolate phosphatase [unclassified Vibrio]|uniref:Phosphoglycolate phosphatase n=1 Tax=Vibrio sp. HB236076 TaxID=3232307 RepID=A0AB39HCV9_9VIBR|nr:phosphoglycolate phosphatase [Vibrio sp. HB161653]MDP5255316.1 phosphoglycolate phosphatase [Vibrio sp. HB161653]
MKFKLIAFDLDGTLLDSVPDLALAAQQTVKELGYPAVTEEQVRDYVGNGADILIGRALSQSIDVNPEIPVQVLQQARHLFDEFYAQSGHRASHLYPNVASTLAALKKSGHTLAIVTNKPSKFVPEILEQHAIGEYFSEVLGGDAFAEKKPNPVALLHLQEKFAVSAEDMLMVGDSKNDILAARNAGCQVLGLTYGYNHGEPINDSAPDYVSDDINVLLDIVK